MDAAEISVIYANETRMKMSDTTITYQGKHVSVRRSQTSWKRVQAEERRDRRHLSKSMFETTMSHQVPVLGWRFGEYCKQGSLVEKIHQKLRSSVA